MEIKTRCGFLSASWFLYSLSFFLFRENEFALNGEVDQENRAFRDDFCQELVHMKRADKQVVKKQGVDKKNASGKSDVFDNRRQRIFVPFEHNASVYGEVEACAYDARTYIGKHIPEGRKKKPVQGYVNYE